MKGLIVNPYEVAEYEVVEAERHCDDLHIEGDLVRCGNICHFPKLCIITGETKGLSAVRATLYYCPFWVYAIAPITLVIAALIYAVIRKRCDIVYYISPAAKVGINWKRFGGSLAIIAGMIGFVIAFRINAMNQLLMLGPAVLMIAGVFIAMKGENCPLSIVRTNGTAFWVKGCKAPFFQCIDLQRPLADKKAA
jgi:hypothetical protein